jgi:hypothetical protein
MFNEPSSGHYTRQKLFHRYAWHRYLKSWNPLKLQIFPLAPPSRIGKVLLDKSSSRSSPWRTSLSDVFELFLECLVKYSLRRRFFRFSFPFVDDVDVGIASDVVDGTLSGDVGTLLLFSSTIRSEIQFFLKQSQNINRSKRSLNMLSLCTLNIRPVPKLS